MSRVRQYLPDWAVVMGIAGAVGAASAVLSVAAYREFVITEDVPLAVPSDVRHDE